MYLYLGIWKQMSSEHKMRDVKLQRIQNLWGKATCPLLYLLELFVEKSSKNEGMLKEEIKSTTQLCKDVYQLVQVTYSEEEHLLRMIYKTGTKIFVMKTHL